MVDGATFDPAPLHPVNRRHLDKLSTELGILQHSTGSQPDPARGSCVDDVARALEVDLLHARTIGWSAVAMSAARNLRFLEDAFDETTGRFITFRNPDGSWVDNPAANDGLGRTMLALGQTIADASDARLVERAIVLFGRGLRAAGKVTSPRGQAAMVLACAAVVRSVSVMASTDTRDTDLAREVQALERRLATGLHARFLDYAKPGWPWPEEALTYENALLPRALIVGGHLRGAETMLAIGLQVLDWLIAVQSAPEGHFTPIGNGFWAPDGERSRFDQQPIEATSLLLAAEAAYEATGDPRYRVAMERAYAWFLGANDLGRRIATPGRGAGAGGLTPTGVNRNEGAESTLMWLIAAEHIRALRAAQPRTLVPIPRGRAPRPTPATMLGGNRVTGAPA